MSSDQTSTAQFQPLRYQRAKDPFTFFRGSLNYVNNMAHQSSARGQQPSQIHSDCTVS